MPLETKDISKDCCVLAGETGGLVKTVLRDRSAQFENTCVPLGRSPK
jgi:hypothetical protein